LATGLAAGTNSFKLNPESASVSSIGVDADGSAHALDIFPHNSQADAGALVLLHRMNSLKDIEYPVKIG
jgi:hypothetical protein